MKKNEEKQDYPMLMELDPKVLQSMNEWFEKKGLFERLRKVREEQAKKEAGEKIG